MKTMGARFVEEYTESIESLKRFMLDGYQPSSIRDAISTIGTKTEIFLKSVALPGNKNRNTFEWFIDKLDSLGIDQSSRDKLHSLRRLYNKFKHDPAYSCDLLSSINIVSEGFDVIKQISMLSVGNVLSRHIESAKRVYWLAIWDHFVGGDSEVHIMLPSDSDNWLGPPIHDIIYVDIKSVESICQELQSIGTWAPGKDFIPANIQQIFESESDFYESWIYEGNYIDLITILASHELRQDLAAGLNRHDSKKSMLIAMALAAIDIAKLPTAPVDYPNAIYSHAVNQYAVPPDNSGISFIANELGNLILAIPGIDRPNLIGPLWARQEQASMLASNAMASVLSGSVIIDSTLTMRLSIV